MKQMRKLLELQRAKTPNKEDEEDEVVKMEYLRDILFQYMTGRNSSVRDQFNPLPTPFPAEIMVI